ncbi:hypothetical protein EYF80_065336 [Liparis tanakae]|uniref:Uncharacterized protein n=1 Tax=Liparis tanakae TaxID=230148 RepID=A0A4Z2E6V9_9TELE|nr:hypothetical protein EYF80_065336 [Liparis tanakae]
MGGLASQVGGRSSWIRHFIP